MGKDKYDDCPVLLDRRDGLRRLQRLTLRHASADTLLEATQHPGLRSVCLGPVGGWAHVSVWAYGEGR